MGIMMIMNDYDLSFGAGAGVGAIHTTELFEILFSCIYQIFSIHVGDLGRSCVLKRQKTQNL
jgi:hypothetical protein